MGRIWRPSRSEHHSLPRMIAKVLTMSLPKRTAGRLALTRPGPPIASSRSILSTIIALQTKRGNSEQIRWQPQLGAWSRKDTPSSLQTPTASGILVLDFDHADGGVEQLAEWEREHGSFTEPRVRTGSGGVHLYFLREKSLEAGLGADTLMHFAKLKLRARDPEMGKESFKEVGVDMRDVSLNGMIACPPSSYQRGEKVARYTAASRGELPAVDALPQLPDWVIGILNERASRAAGGAKVRMKVKVAVEKVSGVEAPSAFSKAPDLADAAL
ncbi:hypothetical protein KFL_006900040 [Klebsormidium nitens]|uniref:DNA primase/polymerase bifunctional N-terminal domain-containing protein n=1 Tax=Klebsormidium nitens TaxID=105231 RepID=A0A1Y1IMZ3_KLENI|nr:hypothetical protein KFL_006900040 [Klebsormidium nitens]|eukprot:GAQ90829.1 hypothetical protein KFL_006900040 [Klebsormidium nitens]